MAWHLPREGSAKVMHMVARRKRVNSIASSLLLLLLPSVPVWLGTFPEKGLKVMHVVARRKRV